MLKICLVGGLGKMGKAIASVAGVRDDVSIVSVWERADRISAATDYGAAASYTKNPVRLVPDGRMAIEACEVVVDFSSQEAFDQLIGVCEELSKPLVTGTTGVADKEKKLTGLARKVAVVSSPNMAMGVNAVFSLCESLGNLLGEVSDIEIVESHHRTKKDVPSGTALEIARIISSITDRPVAVGRPKGTGMRRDEIVIHSLRVGDVAGKHTIMFSPKGEIIEISHTAQSRDCFAAGALRAAGFAARAAPGLYGMRDVLKS